MELKPPTKPGKNATQKALAAYHSQLRRYHRMLEEWDAKLRKRHEELIKALRLDEEDDDEGGELECGCSEQDAINGCDCPECEQWRSKAAMMTQNKPLNPEETNFFAQYEEQMKIKDKE